ncbi:hypothetical protein ACJMK2_024974 [Sinanodonta woodiana]|uniref:Uncharacterized protein n=1 Tax=Sinanodonta woodiana TaxID=1069815 RepID=A0ABD3XF31_SINWO
MKKVPFFVSFGTKKPDKTGLNRFQPDQTGSNWFLNFILIASRSNPARTGLLLRDLMKKVPFFVSFGTKKPDKTGLNRFQPDQTGSNWFLNFILIASRSNPARTGLLLRDLMKKVPFFVSFGTKKPDKTGLNRFQPDQTGSNWFLNFILIASRSNPARTGLLLRDLMKKVPFFVSFGTKKPDKTGLNRFQPDQTGSNWFLNFILIASRSNPARTGLLLRDLMKKVPFFVSFGTKKPDKTGLNRFQPDQTGSNWFLNFILIASRSNPARTGLLLRDLMKKVPFFVSFGTKKPDKTGLNRFQPDQTGSNWFLNFILIASRSNPARTGLLLRDLMKKVPFFVSFGTKKPDKTGLNRFQPDQTGSNWFLNFILIASRSNPARTGLLLRDLMKKVPFFVSFGTKKPDKTGLNRFQPDQTGSNWFLNFILIASRSNPARTGLLLRDLMKKVPFFVSFGTKKPDKTGLNRFQPDQTGSNWFLNFILIASRSNPARTGLLLRDLMKKVPFFVSFGTKKPDKTGLNRFQPDQTGSNWFLNFILIASRSNPARTGLLLRDLMKKVPFFVSFGTKKPDKTGLNRFQPDQTGSNWFLNFILIASRSNPARTGLLLRDLMKKVPFFVSFGTKKPDKTGLNRFQPDQTGSNWFLNFILIASRSNPARTGLLLRDLMKKVPFFVSFGTKKPDKTGLNRFQPDQTGSNWFLNFILIASRSNPARTGLLLRDLMKKVPFFVSFGTKKPDKTGLNRFQPDQTGSNWFLNFILIASRSNPARTGLLLRDLMKKVPFFVSFGTKKPDKTGLNRFQPDQTGSNWFLNFILIASRSNPARTGLLLRDLMKKVPFFVSFGTKKPDKTGLNRFQPDQTGSNWFLNFILIASRSNPARTGLLLRDLMKKVPFFVSFGTKKPDKTGLNRFQPDQTGSNWFLNFILIASRSNPARTGLLLRDLMKKVPFFVSFGTKKPDKTGLNRFQPDQTGSNWFLNFILIASRSNPARTGLLLRDLMKKVPFFVSFGTKKPDKTGLNRFQPDQTGSNWFLNFILIASRSNPARTGLLLRDLMKKVPFFVSFGTKKPDKTGLNRFQPDQTGSNWFLNFILIASRSNPARTGLLLRDLMKKVPFFVSFGTKKPDKTGLNRFQPDQTGSNWFLNFILIASRSNPARTGLLLRDLMKKVPFFVSFGTKKPDKTGLNRFQPDQTGSNWFLNFILIASRSNPARTGLLLRDLMKKVPFFVSFGTKKPDKTGLNRFQPDQTGSNWFLNFILIASRSNPARTGLLLRDLMKKVPFFVSFGTKKPDKTGLNRFQPDQTGSNWFLNFILIASRSNPARTGLLLRDLMKKVPFFVSFGTKNRIKPV